MQMEEFESEYARQPAIIGGAGGGVGAGGSGVGAGGSGVGAGGVVSGNHTEYSMSPVQLGTTLVLLMMKLRIRYVNLS